MLAYLNEGDRNARCSVENRCDAAMEAYEKALGIAQQLWKEKESLETRLDLAELNKAIGHIVGRQESDKASLSYFEKALAYLRDANRLSASRPNKQALYRCCFDASKVYLRLGEADRSLALLKESEALNMEVLNGFQYRVARNDLAQTLAAFGDWYKSQWEIEKALDYYKRSCLLVKRLWHENKTLRRMNAYSQILKKYIAAAKLDGDFDLVDELKSELHTLMYNVRQVLG
jgi:tetratricopeptide (TPR) repeat protein